MKATKTFLSGYIFIALTLISFSCKNQMQKEDVYIQEDKVIYKGFEIPLYEISITEIEKHFGSDYEKIDWSGFAIEHLYKEKGISFSYRQKDSSDMMIYWVNIETKENTINMENRIQINSKTSVKEVVEVFGENEWDYDNTYNGLIIQYDYFDLILELTEDDIQMLDKEFIDDNWIKYYNLFKNHRIKGIEVF